MMDFQQVLALAIVAAAAGLLVLRYARGRRKSKFPECANCAAASMHAPAVHAPEARTAPEPAHGPGPRPADPPAG
jgi:hypothetical protein